MLPHMSRVSCAFLGIAAILLLAMPGCSGASFKDVGGFEIRTAEAGEVREFTVDWNQDGDLEMHLSVSVQKGKVRLRLTSPDGSEHLESSQVLTKGATRHLEYRFNQALLGRWTLTLDCDPHTEGYGSLEWRCR